MNRWVIFAHYDKNSIIDDYVIYYLERLKEIAQNIVFVSDCNLQQQELGKLTNITNHVIAKKHGEYDWGSYKYGFKYIEENNLLNDIEELVLCNDSVYGPIYSLKSYIDKLSNNNTDFGGIYKNNYGLETKKEESHIQSWFILLKKQVFCSDIFKKFIYCVDAEFLKEDIINKYEIGFTKTMKKYFSFSYLYSATGCDAVYCAPFRLIDKGFPFCKVSVVTRFNIINFLKWKNKELTKLIKIHQKRCHKRNYFINFIRHLKYTFKYHNANIEVQMNLKN